MSYTEAIKLGIKRFGDFDGRSRRSEYWYFVLTCAIINFLLYYLSINNYMPEFIRDIFSLVTFIPVLSVSIRRLHDIGKSAWNLLMILVPLIGAISLIVFYTFNSEKGTNRYGSNPKEEE